LIKGMDMFGGNARRFVHQKARQLGFPTHQAACIADAKDIDDADATADRSAFTYMSRQRDGLTEPDRTNLPAGLTNEDVAIDVMAGGHHRGKTIETEQAGFAAIAKQGRIDIGGAQAASLIFGIVHHRHRLVESARHRPPRGNRIGQSRLYSLHFPAPSALDHGAKVEFRPHGHYSDFKVNYTTRTSFLPERRSQGADRPSTRAAESATTIVSRHDDRWTRCDWRGCEARGR
jgi:hypothetical protein